MYKFNSWKHMTHNAMYKEKKRKQLYKKKVIA